MRWSALVRRLLIAVGGTTIVVAAAAWFVAGELLAPANQTVGPPPEGLAIVSTTLPSKSGSQIATWYLPADGATATVILVHGIRSDRRSMLGRARLLHDAGFAVVLIDLQAHGESPGEHITVGHLERHDVAAAVDYARKLNPDHRIGLVGCSLGGVAAVLAAPTGLDALVLEMVFPTIEEAVSNRVRMRLGPLYRIATPLLVWQLPLRLGISPAELRPIDRIADVACPVLIIAGDQDQHTTLAETERLFAAAREPKKLVIFPGAAHVDLQSHDSARYADSVLRFLKAHLGDAAPVRAN